MATTLTTDEKIARLGYGRGTQRVTDDYSIIELPYGKIMFNSHDTSLWGNLQCSIPELEDLKRFITGTVLDIGACLGSHSVAWAEKAEIIYAFEPQPWNYYLLCANLALNKISNVTPCQLALGDFCGITHVSSYDPGADDFTLMGVQTDHGNQTAMIRTIDSLEIPDVKFIKIDTEGYEARVLKGGRETLLRCDPVVYVEMHGQWLIDEIVPFMKELGYEAQHWRTIVYIEQPEDMLNHGWIFWKEGKPWHLVSR